MVYEDDSFTSASFIAVGKHARSLPPRRALVEPPSDDAHKALVDGLSEAAKEDPKVMEYLAFSEKARDHAKERMKAIKKGEEAAKVKRLRDDERERMGNWFDAFVGTKASVSVPAKAPNPNLLSMLASSDTTASAPSASTSAASTRTSAVSKPRLDHTAVAPPVPGRRRYGCFWRFTDTPDKETLVKFAKEAMALVESTQHLLPGPPMPFELWVVYRTGKGIAGLQVRDDGEIEHKVFGDISSLLGTLDGCFGLGHDFWACDRVSMLHLVSFLKARVPFIWGYNGGDGEALWVAYVKEEVVGLLDGSREEEGKYLIYWLDEGAARRIGNAIGSFFLPEFGPRRLQFLRDAISCYGGVVWKAAKPEQEGSGSSGLFWANRRLIRADPKGTPRAYSDELYLVEMGNGEGGDVAMEEGVGEGKGDGGSGAAGAGEAGGSGAGAAGATGATGATGGARADAGPSSAAATSSRARGKKRASSASASSKAAAPSKTKKGARGVDWAERWKRCTIACEECWETEDGELVRQDDEEWVDFSVRHLFQKHWPPKVREDGTVEHVPCPATAWEGCRVWSTVEKTPKGVSEHLKVAHKKVWDRLRSELG